VQEDVDTDVHGHIIKAAQDWRREADDIISHANCWTYVGEWSLGLNPKMLDLWQQAAQQPKQSEMDTFQQALTYRAYASAQLLSFEKYLGWFFWSYKTEDMLHWSFRECVSKGWLPERFD
jgi:glucan 1,3-beta-glucosidase